MGRGTPSPPLTQDLLDLPGRFDRFVETQHETNQAQQETNRLTDRRFLC